MDGKTSHILKMIPQCFQAMQRSDISLMPRWCWYSLTTDYTLLITQNNDAASHSDIVPDGVKRVIFN